MPRSNPKEARNPARILIVDDHPMVRQGLMDALSEEPDLEVCGQASDTRGALRALKQCRPDLIILDLSFSSGSDGLDFIKDLRYQGSTPKVLVFSMHDESLYAERVLRAGAQGFLNKEASTDEIVKAVNRVLQGEVYLSGHMSSFFVQRAIRAPAPESSDGLKILSDREIQVLKLIGRGLSSAKIADALYLSVKTIETHRQNVKKKLGLASGTQLVRYAVNWVETEGGKKNGG